MRRSAEPCLQVGERTRISVARVSAGSNAVSRVLVDPTLADRVGYEPQSERSQKIVGAVVVVLAIICLLSIAFLPSSTAPKAHLICGDEGISRETVNRAMAGMRESTATREEKLATFMQNFQSAGNQTGIQNCGMAILRESEKKPDWWSQLWSNW